VRKSNFIQLTFLILILCLIIFTGWTTVRFLFPLHYQESIEKYAHLNKLDPALVAAVIKTESNFNPFAMSNKDARGLMQITPQTGRWIAERMNLKEYDDDMLYDPVINIRLGCWYINYLFNYYGGDFTLAIAAYNGGNGNVDKWLKDARFSRNGKKLDVIPFVETDKFVKRVQNNYKFYHSIYKWNN
jgi:soluble lytic murein transglycosylase